MKKELRKNPARTVGDLIATVESIWNNMTPEECQNIINTMPQRMKDAIAVKGDATKW